MSQFSLYIHIPFCCSRCSYCDFVTTVGKEALIPDYVTAVCEEIRCLARRAPRPISVKSIYFGGGTPSFLPFSAYRDLFDTLDQHFLLLGSPEITLEANPGDINQEYLAGLFSLGVNRVSLGMQSARQEELDLLLRRHSVSQVREAVDTARLVGFHNLNLDLIYNLPGQSLEDWGESVRYALEREPTHISAYALMLEPGTPLAREVSQGNVPSPDPDLGADMVEFAFERFAEAGFRQYEIANWARISPGSNGTASPYLCRHNLAYWRNEPYLGIGAAAHGYAGGVRTVNVSAPEAYIKRLEEHPCEKPFPRTPATLRANPIDRKTEMQETMMMGLRLTEEGVDEDRFRDRFGVSMRVVFKEEIKQLTRQGLLTWRDGALLLTEQGKLLGNQVFMQFVD